MLIAQAETGICRVVCFSPRHDLTLSQLDNSDLRRVIDVWSHEYEELGSLAFVKYVQIFENRGSLMGASNPHPHGQIWASSSIPNEPVKEQRSQESHYTSCGTCLLCDYLATRILSNEFDTVTVYKTVTDKLHIGSGQIDHGRQWSGWHWLEGQSPPAGRPELRGMRRPSVGRSPRSTRHK